MRDKAWAVRAVLIAGVLVAGTRPLQAQRISIAPNIGVYIPTTELVKAASGQQFKQEVSITLGGRLGFFFGQRFGVEFTGAYAPSKLKFTSTGTSKEDANIFTGGGRLTYLLLPWSSPVAFMLTGGVGVIHRSGTFYQDVQKKTDVGGTAGASARFRLGKLLRLQLTAEDYIYKPKADLPGFTTADKKTQNDINLSVGIGIPLLGLGQMGQ